ncbi:MAG: hypothetical protein DID90_2727552393 [Candidatus Nitrotoga sp. LAW]|nr:MAG: hypothetical protein DID90_2727552393 [Candidatus Nitrotoga sp. LAW]
MRPGKRKALPKTTEGKLLEKVEHTKVSIRAKVEHPFHVVKNLFLHCKARYRGLAKHTAQLFSLFGFANLKKMTRKSPRFMPKTNQFSGHNRKTHPRVSGGVNYSALP